MNVRTIVGKCWLGGEQTEPARIRIESGRIEAVERGVFDDSGADVLRLAGDQVLLPGFHDAHVHLIVGGLQMAQIDFTGAHTVSAVQERIADYVARTKPERGQWVLGFGLEQTEVTVTRVDIDRVLPDRPFFAWTHDLHSAVANSAALIAARVDGSSANPAGGSFDRGADGKLSGMLRESAAYHVREAIPTADEAECRQAFLRAQDHALSHGITTVSDSVRPDLLDAYLNVADSADQIVRMNIWRVTSSFDIDADRFQPRESAQFRSRCFKGFTDGALGSRTASFWEPYSDDPHNAGTLLVREGPLARFIRAAHKESYQIAMHAIGDRANSVVLDAIEMATCNGVGPELRPRIEHCQNLRERDIERFAKLGVIASMQPIHCTADMGFVRARIGEERETRAYAWKSLLRNGAMLAFGSDWPIEDMSPIAGIHAAVTRTRADGTPQGGWHAEQCIEVRDAVRAYTTAAAYAAGWEDRIGKIDAGYFADLCVLSGDPFTTAPEKQCALTVERTLVNGKTVYERAAN